MSNAVVSANPQRHLLIFARHPELGRVKTRLAQTIGDEAALEVYCELLAHTQAAASGVAATRTVWFADAKPAAAPPDLWADYLHQTQGPGDLGAKMHRAFAEAFAAGASAVVIIGTDCPGLTSAHLTTAFDCLATHDVVLGPAHDGGYYLLGMSTLHADLFLNKTWSTASVLAHTLRDATRLGLTVHQLPQLRDVDTAEDLVAWRAAQIT
ncbi:MULTISPECIES: TIGR04282 family arsenosugar biosynthesis glycosyltransferase [Hymenobacter]|uniref:Glycosyltransferase n=1 Tax=Hymenobacter jejuensis TaxID=2502781 RepID=A0A5B8A6D0_9BACT|nr:MULTISPECIES: TIGR04282 family arsenosugar biosynthesis glycosyltransferase [Hymenobacter]MBC6990274.1 TIGR04282 family arsenosugar biosynthesis glycosyltransferase [Hymenobacter sp. BT491]QDA62285.1 glycosyltransferase [Hymenobacter jejuensis]